MTTSVTTPTATTNTTSATSTAASATTSTVGTGSALSLASDFETFLQMLTAQARYQDPLEPLDSTEYASQLAQFSMVEQQVQTNDALAQLASQMNVSSMASLAGWVGMEARAVMPAYFDGTPITVAPNPAAVADEVYLVVTDGTGTEVERRQLPVSADPIEWVGIDDDGAVLPAGVYSFTIESYSNEELVLSESAEVYSRITEAQAQSGEIILILEGGEAVISTAVTGLRDPA